MSEIADYELSPKVLSSKVSYLIWALVYSIIHLSLCLYLFALQPAVFSREYNLAVAALIIGPFVYLPDLYLRQIWLPYRREMKLRGGVPRRKDRKHPYDLELKIAGLVGFFAPLAGVIAMNVFVWFEEVNHLRTWIPSLMITVGAVPFINISFCHSYFVWKGNPVE